MAPEDLPRHEVGAIKKTVAVALLGAASIVVGANALQQGSGVRHETKAPVALGDHLVPSTTTITGDEAAPTTETTPVSNMPSTVAPSQTPIAVAETIPKPEVSASSEANWVMQRDAVQIGSLGCSGFLIRNDNRVAIGVLTAAHCGLLAQESANNQASPYFTRRIKASDGQTYVVVANPVVKAGVNGQDLPPNTTISEFILPPDGDQTHDQAIGVFNNQDPQTVLNRYNQEQLSLSDIAALPKAQDIYMSGWPKNSSGGSSQQYFTTKLLGIDNGPSGTGVPTAAQSNLKDIVLTAVPQTDSDAVCSPGTSGAGGFIMQPDIVNGQTNYTVKTVGELAYYLDLTKPVAPGSYEAKERERLQQKYGNLLSGKGAICGFSPHPPNEDIGEEKVRVAHSLEEVPGYLSPDQQIARDRQVFYDPNTPRTILNGDVVLPATANSGNMTINRPALNYNPVSDTLSVMWYSPNDTNNLSVMLFTKVSSEPQPYQIFSPNPQTAASFQQSTGSVVKEAPASGSNTNGDFKDSSGSVFGGQYNKPQQENGTPYNLVIDASDNMSLQARPSM